MLTNVFIFFPFVTFLTLDLKIGLDKHEVLDKHILWTIHFFLTFQQTVYLINSFDTLFIRKQTLVRTSWL